LEISMMPARLNVVTRSLVNFWNEARLRADQAKSTSVRPAPGTVPWRDALEDVLKVGYGVQTQSRFAAGAWELVRWRTVPSAGALYPFEVIASVVGEGNYLWDLEQGRLVPCGLPPLSLEELAKAGLVTLPGHRLEALLILVARPWLSMRKYRLRGYSYCHLDVGHLATNLAVYTNALGHLPTLHLRFSRAVLAECLRLEGMCREPLAVLSFTSAEPADAAPQPVTGGQAEPGPLVASGLELPGELEILNWESLQGILSFDFTLDPPGPIVCAPLLAEPPEVTEEAVLPLPVGYSRPAGAREWRSAILGRRSAKGFLDGTLSAAQIDELLGALRDESVASDGSADPSMRLGLRLVTRNVEGLTGVFAYSPQRHALYRIDAQADDPRPACMCQEMARDAAALIILHAPICRLVDSQGYSPFTELHFRAAELGQRLHLAAARLRGVGMTCIGGFDGQECAALARLDPGEEAIYVILLGVPDENASKHDRLKVAFSHGFTTVEG
jgi:SagB-type dehydrogenase family enzyme